MSIGRLVNGCVGAPRHAAVARVSGRHLRDSRYASRSEKSSGFKPGVRTDGISELCVSVFFFTSLFFNRADLTAAYEKDAADPEKEAATAGEATTPAEEAAATPAGATAPLLADGAGRGGSICGNRGREAAPRVPTLKWWATKQPAVGFWGTRGAASLPNHGNPRRGFPTTGLPPSRTALASQKNPQRKLPLRG